MANKNKEVLEGGGASKLVQLIQQLGYNKDMDIELATVTADAPTLKIKIDNMSEELLAEDLIVAEHLTKHKRKIKLTIPELTLTDFKTSSLNLQHTMGSAGQTAHTHSLNFSGMTLTGKGKAATPINTEAVFAEIEFTNELKKDERVAVLSAGEGQVYYILDRVVTY